MAYFHIVFNIKKYFSFKNLVNRCYRAPLFHPRRAISRRCFDIRNNKSEHRGGRQRRKGGCYLDRWIVVRYGREPISMIYHSIRWLLREKRGRSHYLYGTFIFMYRTLTARDSQEIKCRPHGREWNKRFSWRGEAAKEREEIDSACRTTAANYWWKLRKPICNRGPFSLSACVTREDFRGMKLY